MEISDRISRREAIQRVTMLLGGVALIDGDRILAAMPDAAAQAAAAQGFGTFTADDVAFLDEVADTILPETSTPGAKAAHTGAFMALMVTDAYTPRNQQIFRDGMQHLEGACQREYAARFIQARPEQRLALLQRLDAERQAEVDALEARRRSRAPVPPPLPPDAPVHYFRLMKELALLGYFTSEIGYRQAMRYIETPGRYDPCAPHKPGERIWASHA
ncbi:MAG TPA: gluconate 2-dehydrogenase subunit 3 family protein [Vicinamibacterales bacterium]|nr:gluconate 2-dehydrogenase subunit 3 family protein [Vicinamibacterales bacterium]